MDGHSRMSKGLYEELYDYTTLEAAYDAAFLYLDDAPEDSEAWLINLQNHLVWRSYEPGQNPDEDSVVLTAIGNILKAHGLKSHEVKEPELRRVIADLTLN